MWNPLHEHCTPIQEALPDNVDRIYVKIIFSMFYIIVWIFAVMGNSLVLYIVTVKQVCRLNILKYSRTRNKKKPVPLSFAAGIKANDL